MFPPLKFVTFLACMSLSFLIACSGGTGGTGANGGSNSVVVGTITQVNTASSATATATSQQVVSAANSGASVTINGIQFDISSSSITLDGLSGSETDLRVGMVATVKGSIDASGATGIADTLSVKEVIKGPVTNVDPTNNTITVLNQTVQVSAATHWDNVTDITLINNNDIVEVSGYVKNNNVIAATRVERLSSTETEFKITGNISASDPTAKTFNLGNLVVDYTNATLSNIPNDAPDVGMYVEVKGTFDKVILTAKQVNAEKLEVSDADNMELQGFVTSVASASSFNVNHQPVQIDANTQFSGGTATDIVAGVLVDVSGPLVSGIVIANRVSFEDSVKITAVVNAIDTSTISLTGLDGLAISINASTEFEGNIAAGNTVTVRGNFITGTPEVIATQISLDTVDASTDVSLQGPVTNISDPDVEVLGTLIKTSSFQDSDFIVEGSMTSGRSAFFSLVTTGDVVTAKGSLSGNTIGWQQLIFEIPK